MEKLNGKGAASLRIKVEAFEDLYKPIYVNEDENEMDIVD